MTHEINNDVLDMGIIAFTLLKQIPLKQRTAACDLVINMLIDISGECGDDE